MGFKARQRLHTEATPDKCVPHFLNAFLKHDNCSNFSNLQIKLRQTVFTRNGFERGDFRAYYF